MIDEFIVVWKGMPTGVSLKLVADVGDGVNSG